MFWGFCYCIQKFLPDRESNPGLPRDRRRSSPLDYRGHDAVKGPLQRKQQNCRVQTVQKSFEPDLNQRPMDVWDITTTVHRSTNWAIEGCMRVSHKSASIFIISNSVLELHTYQGLWLIHLLMLASKCQGGDVAQMVERSLSMWEVGGSIPPVSKLFFTKPFRGGGRSIHFIYNIYTYWSCPMKTKTLFASSGNRTRAARVAGEHSTTEPTMLSCCFQGIYFSLFVSGIYVDILFAALISRRYLLYLHFGVRSSITSFTCPFNRTELNNYLSSSILENIHSQIPLLL